MKFNKCVWPREKGWRERSKRRVAMAKRAVEKEKESMALFPDLARWKSADEKMNLQDEAVYGFGQDQREFAAIKWRQARRELNELPAIISAGIKRYWQDPDVWLPRDPAYLLSAIHSVKNHGESYWRRLRIKRQFVLIREGKLPKSVIQSIRAWDKL